jgi:hypothetical protein
MHSARHSLVDVFLKGSVQPVSWKKQRHSKHAASLGPAVTNQSAAITTKYLPTLNMRPFPRKYIRHKPGQPYHNLKENLMKTRRREPAGSHINITSR